MKSAEYGGQAYQSGIRSGVAGALMGLAALVATAPALAQDPIQVAYRNSNLASLGVPDVSGLRPIRTKWLDKTKAIPGAETRFDVYRVGKGLVAHYSTNGQLYAVLHDVDGKKPLEYAFVDNQGKGRFERVAPKSPSRAPNWIK